MVRLGVYPNRKKGVYLIVDGQSRKFISRNELMLPCLARRSMTDGMVSYAVFEAANGELYAHRL